MTASTTGHAGVTPSTQDGRRVGDVPSFDVTLRIRRYNPEVDSEPQWKDYTVRVHGTDRLLHGTGIPRGRGGRMVRPARSCFAPDRISRRSPRQGPGITKQHQACAAP